MSHKITKAQRWASLKKNDVHITYFQ